MEYFTRIEVFINRQGIVCDYDQYINQWFEYVEDDKYEYVEDENF